MRAYVEIDIESGRDVIASAEYIRQIEGVTEAYAVSDICDVFAAVEADDFRDIFEFVMRKIQVIRGVTDTRILPCIDVGSEKVGKNDNTTTVTPPDDNFPNAPGSPF